MSEYTHEQVELVLVSIERFSLDDWYPFRREVALLRSHIERLETECDSCPWNTSGKKPSELRTENERLEAENATLRTNLQAKESENEWLPLALEWEDVAYWLAPRTTEGDDPYYCLWMEDYDKSLCKLTQEKCDSWECDGKAELVIAAAQKAVRHE